MGNETDHRGPRENTGIAEGGDGRHGDVFRHDGLLADSGVEHRDDI